MKFYRYEAVQYAVLGIDGDFDSQGFPNPKLELRVYNLYKETPKGYWIGYGSYLGLHYKGIWVSKTTKKRYAYPTKGEALMNYKLRTEKRLKILNYQATSCNITLHEVERLLEIEKQESNV